MSKACKYRNSKIYVEAMVHFFVVGYLTMLCSIEALDGRMVNELEIILKEASMG
jgi:hypothetical protein